MAALGEVPSPGPITRYPVGLSWQEDCDHGIFLGDGRGGRGRSESVKQAQDRYTLCRSEERKKDGPHFILTGIPNGHTVLSYIFNE